MRATSRGVLRGDICAFARTQKRNTQAPRFSTRPPALPPPQRMHAANSWRAVKKRRKKPQKRCPKTIFSPIPRFFKIFHYIYIIFYRAEPRARARNQGRNPRSPPFFAVRCAVVQKITPVVL